MRKLIALLGLFMAMLLASCGGGGGYAGDTGPTNVLRMSPVLSGVTLPVGYYSDVAVISQGVKPYHVLSSDPSVHAQLLEDNTLRVYGRRPGKSTVAVQDSSVKQSSISLEVTVQVAALTSSIGESLTLSPGQTQSFTVSGGGEPYTVTSNNTGVATVTGGANGTYTITAGNVEGTASIIVVDAYGATLTITVTNKVAVPLSVSPGTVSGMAGTSATVNVLGGVAPYRVSSSNSAVASASVSGSVVAVSLVSAGTASLTVMDATGAKVPVDVTVTAPTPKFTAIPPSQRLSESAAAPGDKVTFTLLNGTGPYYATIPDNSQNLIQPSQVVVGGDTGGGTGTTPPAAATIDFRRVSGACVAADTTIPVTITDAGSGNTATVKIIMVNDDPAACP